MSGCAYGDGHATVLVGEDGRPRWVSADPRVHLHADLVADPASVPVWGERYEIDGTCPADPDSCHAALRPGAPTDLVAAIPVQGPRPTGREAAGLDVLDAAVAAARRAAPGAPARAVAAVVEAVVEVLLPVLAAGQREATERAWRTGHRAARREMLQARARAAGRSEQDRIAVCLRDLDDEAARDLP